MPTKSLKALIVDDEKAIRRFLRSTLVAEDFEVAEAETIAQARAVAENFNAVQALDLGADDFVTKPFGVAEFMARVRAALRHRVQMQGGPALYDDGRLFVDLAKRIVRVAGEDPKLTPREYGLLHQLVLHAGKVLTHRQLLQAAWPDETNADVQALRVHVRHLRQKIELNPEGPTRITTEPGVGYRFVTPE